MKLKCLWQCCSWQPWRWNGSRPDTGSAFWTAVRITEPADRKTQTDTTLYAEKTMGMGKFRRSGRVMHLLRGLNVIYNLFVGFILSTEAAMRRNCGLLPYFEDPFTGE